MGRKAVVLSSGGVDSTTALAIARAEGYGLYCLTIRYGQRHQREVEAAGRVAKAFGAEEHLVIDIDLRRLGGSALTADLEVPKGRTVQEIGGGIPITYVPARNTIFLAIAMGWAEVLGAAAIFFGANVLDYSGYPDCRPEYLEAFERLAALATKVGVEGKARLRIHAPLIRLSKAEIIRKGLELGVDYGLTWSCYEPTAGDRACGLCDACILRKKGFAEAGVSDPLEYAA